MAFKEDLQNFIDFLKTSTNEDEIKTEYRKIVKLYHPDHAPEEQKSIYNDYILLINKVYSQGKTKIREIQIEEESKTESSGVTSGKTIKKTYVYTHKSVNGKIYQYKCYSYYDYLYKVARNEYDAGHDILHFSGLNHLDKNALEKNSLEVMQHYWNAIKCYKYIIQHCKDPILLSSSKFDLKIVQDANNKLARTLSEDGKSLQCLV